MTRLLALAIVLAPLSPSFAADQPRPVKVGSKKFTESVILGEVAAHLIRSRGLSVEHNKELGGTEILWQALVRGDIDVYPEYTGTIRKVILKSDAKGDEDSLRQALADRGVALSRPLGFSNSYALGMLGQRAKELGIKSISDLRHHPALTLGFSDEFMNRSDGWPGLRQAYALPDQNVRGIDHDLAYRALQSGQLDVTDLYATDAEVVYYQLAVLDDDRRHFPSYDAIFLFRIEDEGRVGRPLDSLAGSISAETMRQLNADVKVGRQTESVVAGQFLNRSMGLDVSIEGRSVARDVARWTGEHLLLVVVSLTAATIVAVPLGIFAARWPKRGQVILGVVGMIQTIPSLALLVFLIPILGIGERPAMVALFLYSLLPIVRNTYSGLHDIPLGMRESAAALGLTDWARLRLIELPLAARSILAGIKTSAVINVGTATLGALIGAGGYGQPILTGIRLDDVGLILQGAIPAAVMALAVHGIFELGERRLVSRGLQNQRVD